MIARRTWMTLLICLTFNLGCGEGDLSDPLPDSVESDEVKSVGKADLYGDSSRDSYLLNDDDDIFADDDSVDGAAKEDVETFLALNAGEATEYDLTNGDVLVAGPGGGLTAVLGCAQGSLYVAAGALTGALATTVAASGAVGGPTVVATSSASVPIYAAAGGLIGLAVSSGAWSQCAGGLARLGTALFDAGGYDSAVRGLQLAIRGSGVNRRPAIEIHLSRQRSPVLRRRTTD